MIGINLLIKKKLRTLAFCINSVTGCDMPVERLKATTMEKVEEFIIENTLGKAKKPEQGEGEDKGDEKTSEEQK